MIVAEVTVDVYATFEGRSYRVYIDNTLMTERTFRWPVGENYVEEHMIIQVEEGQSHTVSIVPDMAFSLKHVRINGVLSNETFII
jgi:hypothetical protein